MKKLLSALKRGYSNTKKTRSRLDDISRMIKNGLYLVNGNKFYIISPVFGFFAILLSALIPFRFSVKKIKTAQKTENLSFDNGEVRGGGIKTVLISGDKSFLVYKSSDSFLKKIRSFENIGLLKYPKMEVLSIDYKECFITVETVKGNVCCDRKHNVELFCSILSDPGIIDSCEHAKIVLGGNEADVVFYYQHGDCHFNNIMWENDRRFKFIDLDNIDLYPAFFDVFYYYAFSSGGIPELLQEQSIIDKMESFLKRSNCYNDNFLDIYLSLFINRYCIKRLEHRNKKTIEDMVDSLLYLDDHTFEFTHCEIEKCKKTMADL